MRRPARVCKVRPPRRLCKNVLYSYGYNSVKLHSKVPGAARWVHKSMRRTAGEQFCSGRRQGENKSEEVHRMKRTTSQTILAGLLAGSLIVPALAQSSSSGIEFQSTRHQIPAGTSVKVKLLQSLSSSSAQQGDRSVSRLPGTIPAACPPVPSLTDGWRRRGQQTRKRRASFASSLAQTVAAPMRTTAARTTPPRPS